MQNITEIDEIPENDELAVEMINAIIDDSSQLDVATNPLHEIANPLGLENRSDGIDQQKYSRLG